MELPAGVADPLYVYELAEKLHMTVGELMHGRGTPMSLHELCVGWPAYYRRKSLILEREQEKANAAASRTMS